MNFSDTRQNTFNKIAFTVGTRPQVIKLASLVKAFDNERLRYEIIHTGQHYDFEMADLFFSEFGLPQPVSNLGVESGSCGSQTGMMLTKLQEAYLRFKPVLVVVPGDTNSALASGLAAAKTEVPLAHVEAGLRSRVAFMAEETNRILLDHFSQLLFAPTQAAYNNLLREGIDRKIIHLTGDVMADNIVSFRSKLDEITLPSELKRRTYVYVTLHRAENVDNTEKLRSVAQTLAEIPKAHCLKVVFPVHPRTRKRLEEQKLYSMLNSRDDIYLLKPVSYAASLRLARDASIVLTDSGGLQKESFILKTPTVTMRETTEWVETVQCGWNILTNTDSRKINKAIQTFCSSEPAPVDPLEFYGDGKASERITEIVKKYLEPN